SAAARDARTFGIPPVQFNVVGRGELQVKEGYLGVVVQYAEGTRTIPFVRQTNDLEYRLTSDIRALTRKDKPVVALLAAPDRSAAANRTFNTLSEQLGENYTVRTVTVPPDSGPPKDAKVLVISGVPDSVPQWELSHLTAFLDSGGGLLLMAGGMALASQVPLATGRAVPWNALLAPYGVSVRSDMVYDLASNEQVTMPVQFGQVLLPYPLWLRALSTRASPLNAEIDAVLLPWASTIDTSRVAKGTLTPLLVTTRAAGVKQTEMFLNPTQQFPRDSLERRLVAVQVNPAAGGAARSRGRLVVVGSGEFATDHFARGPQSGVVLVQNAVDWLAQDEALISIRSKDRSPPPLVFPNAGIRDAVRYGNVVGIPLLLIAAGVAGMLRRRRLTRLPYRPLAA
ncbi:MAG TPA: Gldg family protein, partial [Gemmatimonadales bacterium]|nr:Gldg family protein [Gemmatimonadales bacterium]